MTTVWYAPDSGAKSILMSVSGRLLMVEGELSAERRSAIWDALQLKGGVQNVLDELTRGGISTTPAFGLLSWTGDALAASSTLGVIVRGDVEVTAYTATSHVSVDGRGVSTWSERSVTDAVAFRVTAEHSAADAERTKGGLLLDAGMVLSGHAWLGEPTIVDDGNASDAADISADSVESAAPPQAPTEGAKDTDRVPQGRRASRDTPADITKVEFTRPAAPDSDDDDRAGGDYDHLFGETIVRNVEDAAVRDTEDEAGVGLSAPAPAESPAGDHDGKTQVGLDRAARRAARRAREQMWSTPVTSGPKIFIDLSTGTTEELSQPVLIGRAPSVSKVASGSLPKLVTIAGSDQDISRNHVQVAVEGGTVVVTDLHSRNGTMVVMPNRAPQQLRAGEPTAVIVGTVVDLGGGVTFTVREG